MRTICVIFSRIQFLINLNVTLFYAEFNQFFIKIELRDTFVRNIRFYCEKCKVNKEIEICSRFIKNEFLGILK